MAAYFIHAHLDHIVNALTACSSFEAVPNMLSMIVLMHSLPL